MNDSSYQPSSLFTNKGSDCLDGSRAVWVFYSEDTLTAEEDHYLMTEDRVQVRCSLSWNILWKAAFFGKLQMARPILLLFPLWPEGEHFQPVTPGEDLWVCKESVWSPCLLSGLSTRSSYCSSVTITRAQAMGKRPAEEFQRVVMAERMDSGNRETLRTGGVRDNKRKGRKARLSKDRMPWPTGKEK